MALLETDTGVSPIFPSVEGALRAPFIIIIIIIVWTECSIAIETYHFILEFIYKFMALPNCTIPSDS